MDSWGVDLILLERAEMNREEVGDFFENAEELRRLLVADFFRCVSN
jgi:hypothetical protein